MTSVKTFRKLTVLIETTFLLMAAAGCNGWAQTTKPVATVNQAQVQGQAPVQAETTPVAAAPAKGAPKHSERVIVVSLEDRKLALLEDGAVKKVYTVAVGKPSTPSPVGEFTIESHVANPTYSHNGLVVGPGPGNPVGTRWMGLSIRGYGIHGTNVPSSIGKAASHGCIRMGAKDLEEFFLLVRAGDHVQIVGERNEETARLFGGPLPAGLTAAETATALAESTKQDAVPFVTQDSISADSETGVTSTLAVIAEE